MPKKLSRRIVCKSVLQTESAGESLGKSLTPGTVVLLEGDLGSGKTVFVRGIARGVGMENLGEVRSPTFDLVHEYPGKTPLCHADLYRLTEPEIRTLGLEEYWREGSPWIVAVEWGEKAEKFLSRPPVVVRLEALSANQRRIQISIPWQKKKSRKS